MAEIYHEDIVRHAVIWETNKKKFSNCQPRSIRFLGSKWNVECVVTKKGQNYRIVLQEAKNSGKSHVAMRSFCATTYLMWNDQAFLATVKRVKNARRKLWEFNEDEISDCIPAFNENVAFEIVCCFDVFKPKTETIHLSSKSDAILPTSFDLSPDLQSLSLDLRNLLEDKRFPDVKLKCGWHIISAHKAVLVARSEVFSAMFRNKMERGTGVVDIQDMDIEVLQMFLKYVYSGKIEGLPDDLVPSLYSAGDRYAVHALKKACSERMIECLTEKNCVSLLTVADAHNDAAFKETVVSFICGHEMALQSDNWLEFSGRHLKLANEVYRSYFRSKNKIRQKSSVSTRSSDLNDSSRSKSDWRLDDWRHRDPDSQGHNSNWRLREGDKSRNSNWRSSDSN